MHQTLINAIRSGQVLSFTYDGLPRTVEPHTYGRSTAGNDVLRSYQTAGQSKTGRVPEWTLMKVNKIVGLAVSGVFHGTRPDYTRGDSAMSVIYAER